MLPRHRRFRQQLCAPALILASLSTAPLISQAQSGWPATAISSEVDSQPMTRFASRPDYSSGNTLPPIDLVSMNDISATTIQPDIATDTPGGQYWIAPPAGGPTADLAPFSSADGEWIAPHTNDSDYFDTCGPDGWQWQILPDTLIYHSYQAGVHEPRFSVVTFEERDGRDLWDATLGGRVGILRYGDNGIYRPQGWQLDFEGAAIMRFTLNRARDFETADYRAGVPITYGVGDWQYKFGYYHLSSHMGDEHAIRENALGDRINYVRDSLLAGVSYFPQPYWRVYSEVAYAFKIDGGAEPFEIQFGTELSQPGPTGRRGTPFLAINANLREEHDFGGDITTQVGWLWRGRENQTMRVGFHYFNGKSSQYQTFDDSEEQIGFGMWYDF